MGNAYNIPSCSAGAVVEQLTALYATAYKNHKLNTVPSVMFWGAMGIGKSSAVHQIANRLSKIIQKKVVVTDIRLINFSPVDLRGIPTSDVEKQFAVWLKPKIFDFDASVVNFLFLDELSSAPPSLQASAYQLALDRKIAEFELPDNCVVLAAGNRSIDRSVAYRMPKALANRMIHFEFKSDFDSWFQWALENEVDARVIGYITFAHDKLCLEPDIEELAFPTPRSWNFVSDLLKLTGKSPDELHELIGGCVGVTIATEFEYYCKVYKELPAISDIVNGKHRSIVKKTDVLYALCTSLLSYVAGHMNKLDNEQLENICSYVNQFPSDFTILFYRGALRVEGMNLKLSKVSSFLNWMKKNKRFL